MNKNVINILIVVYILMTCGCMSNGIDYNPSKYNDEEVYVSIKERNFQIWLENQKPIGGNKGFYTIAPCPNSMGHGTY
jgi:hypothetical protein